MPTSPTTLTMAEQLDPDEVWTAVQPLLPAKRLHLKGGRPWIDGAVLGGIIYVAAGPGCRGGCCQPRSGLRQSGDLLAAAARLAAGWRVAGVAPSAAG